MQENQAWISLFRRIPSNLHDALALGLTTGAEIVIQKIVKLEPDFMIIRGRLAGTQDAGRVVMIPYSQLTFVAIMRDLKEAEIESIFGKGAPPALADIPPPAQAEAPTPSEPIPAEDDAAAASSAAEANPTKKSDAASRTVMLAKLRERMKDGKK